MNNPKFHLPGLSCNSLFNQIMACVTNSNLRKKEGQKVDNASRALNRLNEKYLEYKETNPDEISDFENFVICESIVPKFQKKLVLHGGIFVLANKTHTDHQQAVERKRRQRAKIVRKNVILGDGSIFDTVRFKYLRYVAFKVYGNYCACCGCRPENGKLTVDHIMPKSKYPHLAYNILNVQVMCGDCNEIKADNDTTDWRTDEQKELADKEYRIKFFSKSMKIDEKVDYS